MADCVGLHSFGSRCTRVTCDDYEQLLSTGWIRSGNYVYRTINDKTCCPNIPIRSVCSVVALVLVVWVLLGGFPEGARRFGTAFCRSVAAPE